MKRNWFILAGLLMICSCSVQEPECTGGECLGNIVVAPCASRMSVFVDLAEPWDVIPQCEWIKTDVQGRQGADAFTLSIASNKSTLDVENAARKGSVIVRRRETRQLDTLYVTQRGLPDGNQYQPEIRGKYIDVVLPEYVTRRVTYMNLSGLDYFSGQSYMSSVATGNLAVIWDKENVARFQEEHPAGCFGYANLLIVGEYSQVITGENPVSVAFEVDGIWIQVSDFVDAEGDSSVYYQQLTTLLETGYNAMYKYDKWLIGGSFYYYSAVEAGYPQTPSWYPANISDQCYDADRYAWSNNLVDCLWMVSRTYNTTFSNEGRSWKADYVYASGTAWDLVTDVNKLEGAGLLHNPIQITLKYCLK